MELYQEIKRPSKKDQEIAMASYGQLSAVLKGISSEKSGVEIEIEETKERIIIPASALKLLSELLKNMSKGLPFSLVPVAMEVTTQKAAEILGVSRPYLVKLLEEGKIEFTKVGRHRRLKIEDVMDYKKKMKQEQRRRLMEMMEADEESGLYDT